jgi:hypothetical protein
VADDDSALRIAAIAARSMTRTAAKREAEAAEVEQRKADVERRRALLREQMPEVAGVVDMFRAAGVEVRVLAAEENGQVVMTRDCERMGVDVSRYGKG